MKDKHLKTELISPAYRSDITENSIAVTFANECGKLAKIYSQKQPDDLTNATNGSKHLVATVEMNGGNGTFDFPASEFPLGPMSIRVDVFDTADVTDDTAVIDTAYFQFFNYAGIDWRGGIEKAPVNQVTDGMKVTFADNFNSMPILTPTGVKMARTDNPASNYDTARSYATRKIDQEHGGMFGWSFFSDYIADESDPRQKYNPFKLISDGKNNRYMRLNTAYWPDAADGVGMEISGQKYWGQKSTTGYLSSMGVDGSGFFTKGRCNQYFEARMFCGSNPAHWPAFWLLTANGGCLSIPDENGKTPFGAPEWRKGASDELDIIEGYLGNPESYQIAPHEWGYSTGKGGATWVNLNQEIFQHINLAEGFHSLAMMICEEETYYYCDNILVYKHETLKYSWEFGNYFILNGGLSDHFGLPKAEDDTFGADNHPFGFTRYGNECYDYIDFVRVWEDDAGVARSDDRVPLNASHSKPTYSVSGAFYEAEPGGILEIAIDRNPATSSTYGAYTFKFPDYPDFGDLGYKVIEGGSAVNRLREVVKIQIPSHATWKNKHDVVQITPPGSGNRPISVTVKAPDGE